MDAQGDEIALGAPGVDHRVVAYTAVSDLLNEWIVEVDGVRRARFVGPDATFLAAREANRWRRELATLARRDLN